MIKRLFFLAICTPLYFEGQDDFYSKSISQNIGINKITGDSIYAKDIAFSSSLGRFELDSSNNVLLVFFPIEERTTIDREVYELVAYDYVKDSLLWYKFYSTEKTSFYFIDNKFFHSRGGIGGLWNCRTNTFVWSVNSPLIVTKELYERRIGWAPYLIEEGRSTAGISLSDGKILWKNDDISTKRNFFLHPFLIDSQLVFLNTQINGFNLYNGNSWSHDYSVNYFLNLSNSYGGGYYQFGLLGGLIGSALENAFKIKAKNGHDIVVQQHSNELLQDSFFFLASREFMHKISKYGEAIITKNHIYQREVGIAKLVKIGIDYYLINQGFSMHYGKRLYSQCSPFFITRFNDNLDYIDSFDYKVNMNDKSLKDFDACIMDYIVMDSSIFLIIDNGFINLDFNLTVKSAKHIKKKVDWIEKISENFYVYKDSVFYLKLASLNKLIYMKNKDNSIQELSFDGNLLDEFHKSNIYYKVFQDDSILIVDNFVKSFILNEKHKIIAEFPSIKKVVKHDNRYFMGMEAGFFIISSDQLVK